MDASWGELCQEINASSQIDRFGETENKWTGTEAVLILYNLIYNFVCHFLSNTFLSGSLLIFLYYFTDQNGGTRRRDLLKIMAVVPVDEKILVLHEDASFKTPSIPKKRKKVLEEEEYTKVLQKLSLWILLEYCASYFHFF